MRSVAFDEWGRSELTERVRQTLDGCAGLALVSGRGPQLQATLEVLHRQRAERGDRMAAQRLQRVHDALLALATGERAQLMPGAWRRTAAGRILEGTGLQQIPRRCRFALRSSIHGDVLIDADYSAAHPGIVDACTQTSECVPLMGEDGRRRLASALGAPRPTDELLRAVKGALLACFLGASAARVHRDYLHHLGLDRTTADLVREWFISNTPHFQSNLVQPAMTACQVGKEDLPVRVGARPDGIEVICRPRGRWRSLLATRLQSVEAYYMDVVLAHLGRIKHCRLVLPMFDGLLVSAPREFADEVASALGELMQQAAHEARLQAKVRVADIWPV